MNPAILLWLAMMLFAAYKGFEWLSKYKEAPHTISGKIVGKDYKLEIKRGFPRNIYSTTQWFVLEVENNTMTLFCDGNDYDRLNVGDIVKITYSGDMLLKFEIVSD